MDDEEDSSHLNSSNDKGTVTVDVDMAINNKPASPPRIKAYPENTKGPWVVYIRRKQKPLNLLQIAKDLNRKFSAVTDIDKVSRDRLRVVVTDRKQANEIVGHQLFTLEYNVYIPARDVEIEGVVVDESLTRDDLLTGVGTFKNPALPSVKILDSRKLGSSNTIRVTFEGSALPHYVVIGKLRLPVRLFVPRVMNCVKCNQLGHTADYCSNNRCSACGEAHKDATCKARASKCVHCEGDPHDLHLCPEYIRLRDKTKRSLQAQSKRSFAEMLKSVSQPTQPQNNLYSILPVDEGETSSVTTKAPFVFTGPSRVLAKRKAPCSPNIQKKVLVGATSEIPEGKATTNQTPPVFRGKDFESHFPVLPGSSKTLNIPLSLPDQPTQSCQPVKSGEPADSGQPAQPGIFKFSDIVDGLFNMFNFSDRLKSIVTMMLPSVKAFLQKIILQWPFLAMLVSLDG